MNLKQPLEIFISFNQDDIGYRENLSVKEGVSLESALKMIANVVSRAVISQQQPLVSKLPIDRIYNQDGDFQIVSKEEQAK